MFHVSISTGNSATPLPSRGTCRLALGCSLPAPSTLPPGNPANPDSKKRVRFGVQSWDEMFIGFFDAADDPPSAGLAATGVSTCR